MRLFGIIFATLVKSEITSEIKPLSSKTEKFLPYNNSAFLHEFARLLLPLTGSQAHLWFHIPFMPPTPRFISAVSFLTWTSALSTACLPTPRGCSDQKSETREPSTHPLLHLSPTDPKVFTLSASRCPHPGPSPTIPPGPEDERLVPQPYLSPL